MAQVYRSPPPTDRVERSYDNHTVRQIAQSAGCARRAFTGPQAKPGKDAGSVVYSVHERLRTPIRRRYADPWAQPGRRERKSLSTRAPVLTPALANSPASSAAEEMSSVEPGGWTAPSESASASNPCLGARSSTAAMLLVGALVFAVVRRLPVVRLPVVRLLAGARLLIGREEVALACRGEAVPAALDVAVREATRRALVRCGRVRGRPARMPGPSVEAVSWRSPLGESLMRVSIGAGSS